MDLQKLSLKSLYQFLTVRDYPVYSTGIIRRDNRTGLTLTRFWQDNIQPEFRSREYGRQIWRSGGGRNRYISEICNRSERLRFYEAYAAEVCGAAKPETVLRQIGQFARVLTERDYQYDVFCQKLKGYLKLLAQEDAAFSGDAERYFQSAWSQREWFEKEGKQGKSFFCGWFLTLLMLHALSGNGEGEASLEALRRNGSLSPESLWNRQYEKDARGDADRPQETMIYLTGRTSQLCSAPLPVHHFFGREKEMFELLELLREGGKYVITGMGGVGKTELARQLLRCCEQEGLADVICDVQYDGSLKSSFVRAFPQIRGGELESRFLEALARIRLCEGKRILILIDNMDRNDDEDLALLCSLPATVLVTSRYQELEGFTAYPIRTIDESFGELIFRDHYGKPLTPGERDALAGLLKQEIWRHTLTLRFLGHNAAARGWTVEQLCQNLEECTNLSGPGEQDGYGSMFRMYRKMYANSRMQADKKRFLRMWSVLPYQSRDLNFAERFLAGFAGEGGMLRESLEELYVAGWLEKSENGYSMHPFVAECVRSGGVRESDIEPFFEAILKELRQDGSDLELERVVEFSSLYGKNSASLDDGLKEALLLLPAILSRLTGRFSGEVLDAGLLSYGIYADAVGVSREGLAGLLGFKKHCGKLTRRRRAALYFLLCLYGYWEPEEFAGELRSQREDSRQDSRLRNGFLGVLILNNYHRDGLQLEEELERCLEECIQKGGEETDLRVMTCLWYATMAGRKGDFEAMGSWLEKGVEAGRSAGEGREFLQEELLNARIVYCIAVQQLEEALEALEEYERLAGDSVSLSGRMVIAFYRGSIASHRGEEGFGIPSLEEAYALSRALWGNTGQEIQYADYIAELAMAYNKAGRREEAVDCYQQLLKLYERTPGQEYAIHRTLNNLGVAYLDMEKPREALPCLERSYEIIRPVGGLGLGETANNLSKAWRMLGNREKELMYLEEAFPILEQFYGSGHPKVEDGRRRRKEA